MSKVGYLSWYCPKCDFRYNAALPIKAAEHKCPKTRKVVGFKPIKA